MNSTNVFFLSLNKNVIIALMKRGAILSDCTINSENNFCVKINEINENIFSLVSPNSVLNNIGVHEKYK